MNMMTTRQISDLSPTALRIVDAAQSFIQRGGYNGFSYDDISRELGIRKPSIHHHFRTKAELGATVVRCYLQGFKEKLAAIEQREASLAGRLRAYVDLYCTTYGADRLLCPCGMLSSEASELPPEIALEVEAFLAENLRWLTWVIAEGSVRAGRKAAGSATRKVAPQDIAICLLSTLQGSMVVGRGLGEPAGGSDTVTNVGRTALALCLEWLHPGSSPRPSTRLSSQAAPFAAGCSPPRV